MQALTDDRIARILAPYLPATAHGDSLHPAPQLRPSFFDQLRTYVRLLLRWNRSMALTTITDPDDMIRFHFGESIFASSLLMFQNGRLADFGTGAGFPGLPIRMAVPSIRLFLAESNLKKCAFLSEVVREIGLADVSILRLRVEDGTMSEKSLDFVAARAFGQFDLLLGTARQVLVEGGHVVLWLGEKDCRSLAQRQDWNWRAPARIPDSERRFILIGSPKP
jgi:16S rRNA (guanine527-N7)-methyltransferase